jgi:hypothetical protein
MPKNNKKNFNPHCILDYNFLSEMEYFLPLYSIYRRDDSG